MKKIILIASFIFPKRLDWFLNYLEKNFNIKKSQVFVYKNLLDESKYVVTFKFVLTNAKKYNLKQLFPNAVQVNKKRSTFYSINALNKLIEIKMGNTVNVDYKSVIIDWSIYQNQLILINNKKLMFLPLKRLF